jgi:CheY-like chemotaxis protein
MRIMVVDDNRDSANSLATLLQLDGHEVEAAYSGPTALERATTFRPAVMLLDIGLPGMDGYELARRLRATPELIGLRLVALTGYGRAEDQQRTQAAGFDDHLVKPVDFPTLGRVITNP